MTSEPRATGREGFTLIEVLAAMVILAIGLLGLEALGIGAARSIAQADERTSFTAVATELMEQRIQAVRAAAPASLSPGSCTSWLTHAGSGLAYETCVGPQAADMVLVSVQVKRSAASADGSAFRIRSIVYVDGVPAP